MFERVALDTVGPLPESADNWFTDYILRIDSNDEIYRQYRNDMAKKIKTSVRQWIDEHQEVNMRVESDNEEENMEI